ncbi:hypothetical protein A2803_01030 [Candidatus Woesebacteria bacterium RIFCSPHIGHO2_01_FULL_44_21]|uniref:YoaR-like putative peptidoglycan binding domain-containing protein n=1 Tax=Candidatus Woesebacteria bacterium RIFCSPHIGHO2_01_FULL_44_21 TaxID=1802503 RepID=A0A1F7YX39_9BACT|nr:MAG: hypothetical protein A2803_01030 [Candidatus Woesebacteria bacterium RIFCSPHIGHO2_01_FULL_44_21]OGM69717.1 MAG: hypothetical protein A2897_00220 [Candidatus Woesebacteria bacterium RIFCSPLOWO2_01_FULL_44_24b]
MVNKTLVVALLIVIAALSGTLVFFAFFYNKVYPGIYVEGVHIGGKSTKAATEKLTQELVLPDKVVIRMNYKDSPLEFEIPLSSIEAAADYEETVSMAFEVGRDTPWENGKNLTLVVRFNDEKLAEQVNLIAAQSPSLPVMPSLLVNQGVLEFVQGEAGTVVDTRILKNTITEAVKNRKRAVEFEPQILDPSLNSVEQLAFLERGKKFLSKSLSLTSDSHEFTYKSAELLKFLNPNGGYYFDSINPSIPDIADRVKTPPANPVFTFENGRVQEFSPAKDGLEVVVPDLKQKLVDALVELENTEVDMVSVEIPVTRTAPDFATEDVNDLGIKELIGVGKSSFRGSIPSRIYNVSLAASRLNGVLIEPGEVFSFVKTLGDISSLTGYKQAYVIQGNQTILGDGGGVCQVSTTFFRAALNAGLPIVERHAHSYRVGYYEQDSPPGIDATIYHPTVDIKIKNDTPGHILIQTFVDTKNATLRFEFYGTSDGRVSTISKPAVSAVTPPPEDLYVNDPTLPTGEIKQVDYKAWGAKVNFNYKVERNGEVIFEDTYFSNYRPWQAKYLRGTGPTN